MRWRSLMRGRVARSSALRPACSLLIAAVALGGLMGHAPARAAPPVRAQPAAASQQVSPHVLPAVARLPGTSGEQQFQLALEAQSARDYTAMLSLLRQSAVNGDREAQEMLGLALLVGPTLYGPKVKADRCEAGLWLRRAAAQGSEVGRVQLDFLNRLRQSPTGRDVCEAWGG